MRITPKPGFVGKSNKLTRPGAGKVPRRKKGEDMNTKKLMSDDRIDITATYLHGEVFSIQVYIKDSEGYVDKTVRVYYKSGEVEMQ